MIRTFLATLLLLAPLTALAQDSQPTAEGSGSEGSGAAVVPEELEGLAPGAFALEYPLVATTAVEGQYVLCPSRAFIDNHFESDRNSYIYYTATVQAPGEVESAVRTLAGTESAIPNAMLIPLRAGETANVGDIILTWWQTGSGMQRAVVVEGGTPTEPNVRYLDVTLDNPSGIGTQVDTLRPDSFHGLTTAGEIGASLMCDAGSQVKHAILLHRAEGQVLTLGFAGSLAVYPEEACAVVPFRGEYAVGETVLIPAYGNYREATVESVDLAVGRVFATFEFGGQQKTEGVAIVDVAPAPAE